MPNPRTDTDDYTLQEFADSIRVSLSTLKNMIAAGEIQKTYMSKSRTVITLEEAKRFRKSRRRSDDTGSAA